MSMFNHELLNRELHLHFQHAERVTRRLEPSIVSVKPHSELGYEAGVVAWKLLRLVSSMLWWSSIGSAIRKQYGWISKKRHNASVTNNLYFWDSSECRKIMLLPYWTQGREVGKFLTKQEIGECPTRSWAERNTHNAYFTQFEALDISRLLNVMLYE